MATKSFNPVSVVEVLLWGQTVGAVAPAPGGKTFVFEYSPKWIASRIEPAPLLMPLRKAAYQFPSLSQETFLGLPGMLADALPDRFGSAVMDSWLASQGITRGNLTVLDRLAYMGSRGMGALTFRPTRGGVARKPSIIELSKIVQEARSVLGGQLDPADLNAQSLRELVKVGSSAGGARPKLIVAFDEETGQLRSGQLDAPPGFEQWLLKLDGIDRQGELNAPATFGRSEYAYYLMATAAGIEMAECRLLEDHGRAHFMTKRFDRIGNERLHMQTLCALQHLDYNQIGANAYEQLFQTIGELKLGEGALTQAFRRMAFNVIAMNNDDHTKNISFLMDRSGTWSLAPAYDLSFSFDPANRWIRQHLMSVNGKVNDIKRKDLMAVGDRFGVPAPSKLLDDVQQAVAKWASFARQADMSATSASDIQQALDAAKLG